MTFRNAALFVSALLPLQLLGQSSAGTIPMGTTMAVSVDCPSAMRAGTPLRGHLLYAIYADNRLVLPQDTIVTGEVTGLLPDRSRRIHAMLGGDFTPFRIPQVRFTAIVLANGTPIPLEAVSRSRGTQIYRAVAPPPSKGGFLRQEFNSGLTVARDDIALVIAPGRGDRLLQFIYSQIPYHPQRIDKGTSWTVETAAPLDVPAQAAQVATASAPRKRHFWQNPDPSAAPAAPADNGSWIVQAALGDSISSETSHKGEAISAVVAQPIYNPDHTIAVPQGAVLAGNVTNARPSRRFGRTGVLSFSFNQLTFPGAAAENVETRLTGADSAQNVALNSEGQAKARPQDKVAVPLLLVLMAARPLDQDHDHGGGAGGIAGKDAVGGSAGLGLAGTIIGLAGGSPYAAAGLGYWGAARAVYSRWLGHGQKIAFARDTRIVVETTPRRSAPLVSNPPAVK